MFQFKGWEMMSFVAMKTLVKSLIMNVSESEVWGDNDT